MRSPARLVTGTAAAALTAAALGLTTAPSAYADGLGRGPALTAATAAPDAGECLDSLTAEDAEAFCDDGAVLDEEAAAELAAGSSAWSGTGDEGDSPTGTNAGTNAGADLGANAGTSPGTNPGAKPGTRPLPVPPPGTDPEPGRPPSEPPVTRPAPTTPTDRPSGHVRTGVGGSAAPDTAQLAVGGGLLGAAAVGGVWLARRSRADGTRSA
ncbi:hypothetical protein [Streptomyces sp. PpalLS-921]|uniref:hypothetical protein n=1 Tax=Streptomyces sp. PpalLS-921 TaxID=1839772 RepID=UPI00081DB1B1|nr:hypothetical protein [Streptomyces sp. PpalLS-921]SCD84910.1 hypothetical protein GA0115249_1102153 [Streptomyces sp. PpalLS-921]